jgi:hypothetical protein
MVKLDKSVVGSDGYKAAVQELVEIGKHHPEMQAQLRSKAIELGYKDAFFYTKMDSVQDRIARNDEGIRRGIGIATTLQGAELAMIGGGAMAANVAVPAAPVGALGYSLVGMGSSMVGIGLENALGPYRSSEGVRVLSSLHSSVPSYLEQNAVSFTMDAAGLGGGKVASVIGNNFRNKAGIAVNNGSNIGAGDIERPVQAAINTELKTSAIVAEDLSYTHKHVPGHKRHAARVEVERGGAVKAETTDVALKKELLPGEGKVGSYGDLKSIKKPDDNLARHHMPNDQYMRTKGISKNEGVSVMIEQPTPGVGGRHREIHKMLQKQDPNLLPRDALVESILRAREVYKQDGVYNFVIQDSLLDVIKQNKQKFPELFKKIGDVK